MSIDEMIAVLQAKKDGKIIQFQGDSGGWIDDLHETFYPCFGVIRYRVKPEPREWMAYVGNNGEIYSRTAWDVREPPTIKVREVLE